MLIRPLLSLAFAATFTATLSSLAAAPIVVNPSEARGTWQGWGTSLAWWGQAIGNSSSQDLFADLLFTTKTVDFFGQPTPGLGLNIVRYNIGGGGIPGDRGTSPQKPEQPPSAKILPWYKDIDGFWRDAAQPDPASPGWDWTRDANQRAILLAARDRGVTHIEFFANAPLWWMTDKRSSAGGALITQHEYDFSHYLIATIEHAEKNWGLTVHALSPFNEPSAGWWTYPHRQEGCNIARPQQLSVLRRLAADLAARPHLAHVQLTASDENTMKQALQTQRFFSQQKPPLPLAKVNVHSYDGLAAWRDNPTRAALRAAIPATTTLWASEYGDKDPSGLALAQTILEDINHLRPTAWIYWQAIENGTSAWGLANARFGRSPDDPERGTPTQLQPKYHVFAQFTHAFRPGNQILGTNHNLTSAAYDPAAKTLTLIHLNLSGTAPIHFNFANLALADDTAVALTATQTKPQKRVTTSVKLKNASLLLTATPDTLFTVVLPLAKLPTP